MSNTPSDPRMTDAADRAVERAEAAASRRRWVTLAEIVAIAGVVIAALGLWANWHDRREDAAEREAERSSEAKAHAVTRLEGTVANGGTTLMLADPDHKIDTVQVQFPAALGIARQDAPEPRIDADWFARSLLKLTDGGPDAREGKLPVLVTSGWWDADTHRTDRAIYDVVWKTEGRVLRGRVLRLEGLTLRERGGSARRLDALWATEKPTS